MKIIHKRSDVLDKKPLSSDIEYGEIAINYNKDNETLFIKNTNDEIVEFKDKNYIDNQVNKLITNSSLKFFCIEPVSVVINGDTTEYPSNSMVEVLLKTTDEFTINTTSNNSIQSLNGWPKALDTFYGWMEGVQIFTNILFDMNSEDMYTKWNQNNQGVYNVQKAQYVNCVFWSDNAYINDIARRTNYTLYNTFQLPLCYSTIPANTFKPFYLAYGVKSDPNWGNQAYIDSFALQTNAVAPFTYYGMNNIGIFNMAVNVIKLPKDCRGLMFYSPAIERAGVFDASITTNFGAKSGSWREAFGNCDSLKTLYITKLKTSINVSWSPLEYDSIEFIVNNSANTSKITISVSPYTWYRLDDEIIQTASSKNITIALLSGNYIDDKRISQIQNDLLTKQDIINDLDNIRTNSEKGATALQSIPDEYITETELIDFEINGGEY
jgi:hypothetical protein